MSWENFKKQIKSKKFLIGITFVNANGDELERFQTSGIVSDLTDNGIFIFIQQDGSLFRLLYDPESIEVAKHDEYTQKWNKEVISNPDYITEWEVEVSHENSIKEIKKHGFPG